MPLIPAAIAGAPLLTKLIAGGVAGSLLKDLLMGGLGLRTEHKLGSQRISLEKMIAKARIDAAKVENEENRRATERALAMLTETRRREEIESSRDRQMELVMAMLGGLGGFRQQAGQTLAASQRQMPPLALTTLMRGM
ncbi:MAG: hypothetical protein V2A79_09715 [Planctomycetota bacterium]